MTKLLFRSNSSSIPPKLTWESSILYTNESFNIHSVDWLFSVGIIDDSTGFHVKKKVYLKNDFLFYEETPLSKRSPVQALKLDMPYAQISKLPYAIKDLGYKLTMTKNDHSIELIINQPQIWKKALSRKVTWLNFEKDFSVVKTFQQNILSHFSDSTLKIVVDKINKIKYHAEIIDLQGLQNNEDLIKKLESHILKLIKLDHPSLIHIERIYSTKSSIILVKQRVEGQTLEQILTNSTRNSTGLGNSLQRSCILQLYQALSNLEANGLVHHSINPNNVLVTKDRKIKLVGFEPFNLFGEVEHPKYHTPGWARDGFRAPEIRMALDHQNDDSNYRSGMYSVGMIHYAIRSCTPGADISKNPNYRLDLESLVQEHSLDNEEMQVLRGATLKNYKQRICIKEVIESDFFIGKCTEIGVRKIRSFKTNKMSLMNNPNRKHYKASTQGSENDINENDQSVDAGERLDTLSILEKSIDFSYLSD